MAKRIQMTRKKPWRKDNPDAVIVARPTKWGNPFAIGIACGSDAEAVNKFECLLEQPNGNYPAQSEIVLELRGRDLACWCALDRPCHADVLLRYANAQDKEGE